jgi:hypothetical protein
VSGGRGQSLYTKKDIMSCHLKNISVTMNNEDHIHMSGILIATAFTEPDSPGFLPLGMFERIHM